MKIELRDYQEEAINSIFRYFYNVKGNPCVVLPTGAGKSIVIAGFIKKCLLRWPGLRFCILAHRKELIKQNSEKLKTIWHDADIGIYNAGLNKKDKRNQIIYGSIQSIYNKTNEVGAFDILLIDEAHRIPVNDEGQYIQFIKDQSGLTKGFKVCGFTATPYRMKGGAICKADNVLNKICYDAPIKKLIEDGWLCPPVSINDEIGVDLSNIKSSGGDYNLGELNTTMAALDIVDKTVYEIMKYTVRSPYEDHKTFEKLSKVDELIKRAGTDGEKHAAQEAKDRIYKKIATTREQKRKKTIIFAVSIEHAELLSAEIMENGYPCPVITGKTPKSERDKILNDFKNGLYNYLVNCMVLTEGFDSPDIDCVAIARPTQSAGLYAQMAGRGLRTHHSKENCLILDFGGNIERHGPIDNINVPKTRNRRAINDVVEYDLKFCPQCDQEGMNPLAMNLRSCPNCHFIFSDEPVSKVYVNPSTSDIITKEASENWYIVNECHYRLHSKPESYDSFKVEYQCGLNKFFREWVCINHTGFARQKAIAWIKSRLSQEIVKISGYDSVEHYLDNLYSEEDEQQRIFNLIEHGKCGYLKEPTKILVNEYGKYPRIVMASFDPIEDHEFKKLKEET